MYFCWGDGVLTPGVTTAEEDGAYLEGGLSCIEHQLDIYSIN